VNVWTKQRVADKLKKFDLHNIVLLWALKSTLSLMTHCIKHNCWTMQKLKIIDVFILIILISVVEEIRVLLAVPA